MRLYLTIKRRGLRRGQATPQTALLRQAARLTIEAAALWQLPPRLELSLLLTDDEGIRALNREYREQDKPTDVLSFPLWEGADDPGWSAYLDAPAGAPGAHTGRAEMDSAPTNPPGVPLPLGDIVISLERAEEQARSLGHSTTREAVFLFVHGLLHLLGYDHEQGAAEEQRMFALQKQIMMELSFV